MKFNPLDYRRRQNHDVAPALVFGRKFNVENTPLLQHWFLVAAGRRKFNVVICFVILFDVGHDTKVQSENINFIYKLSYVSINIMQSENGEY